MTINLNSAPAFDAPTSPYLSVANSANDPYGFLSDLATATLAGELGGTPVYQSGNQSGTGPCTMPNWNQIRLPDGTLIGAGAAQHNIDLVGLDRYKEQLAALQAMNASTGYTDPALNIHESSRYDGLTPATALSASAAAETPPQSAAAASSGVDSYAQAEPVTKSPSEATPPTVAELQGSFLSEAYAAMAEAAYRLGIEK